MPAAAPIPAPYLEYAAEAALSDVDSFADSLYASCMAAGKVTSEWEARCPGRLLAADDESGVAAWSAQALQHYSQMAAEAQLSRRATDERVARVALLRRAISNLVQAERLADQADTPELSAATADALFNAQMNVERLLSELAQ